MRVRIDPLDKVVSEYIRKRAVVRCGGCERCLTPKMWKELQACHFHGRSRRSVRYDESNLIGACFGCHQYLDSHPLEKIEFFKTLLGEKEFELLNSRMRNIGKPDREALGIYYREKIKELDKEGGK